MGLNPAVFFRKLEAEMQRMNRTWDDLTNKDIGEMSRRLRFSSKDIKEAIKK